jgi:hypothetical protein
VTPPRAFRNSKRITQRLIAWPKRLGIFSKWVLFFYPRSKEKTWVPTFHGEEFRENFCGKIKLVGIISFFMI